MDSTATDLFNLLVSRDYTVKTLTNQGKPETNPGDAEMFSFDFETTRNNYGTVVILLDDEGNFEVYYGDNVGKNMEGADKDSWYDFLNQLKTFATRNLLTFTLKNLDKLKYSMQGMAAINEGLFEGWNGTKHTSYNDKAGKTRLKIVHSKEIGEGEQRWRAIDKLFVENSEGERFKLPFTTLVGGRAMARHVAEGGTPYDIFGQHITELVREANILSKFVRTTKTITEDDAEQYEVVTAGRDRYQTVRNRLKSLAGKRGYHTYKESWDPAVLEQDSAVVEALRGSFITQTVPTQIEEALPYIAQNLQPSQTKESTMKEFDQFANWAENVTEGTVKIPDTESDVARLKEILSEPLPVGMHGDDAEAVVSEVINDDDLAGALYQLYKDQGVEADARPAIEDWIRTKGILFPGLEDLADQVFGDGDSEEDQDLSVDDLDVEQDLDEGDVIQGKFGSKFGSRGMNKHSMSAVKTAQGFFALKDGKVVAGPFDTIDELKAYQQGELNKEAVGEQLDIDTGREQRKPERDSMLEMNAWRKLAGMPEKVYEDFTAFQEPVQEAYSDLDDPSTGGQIKNREDFLAKSKHLYNMMMDPNLKDSESMQAIQDAIIKLEKQARELGLLEMTEDERAAKLEQDILEDWGSSDWSAAVKMFKEYLDQGMSIIDAAEWVVEHFEDYGEDGEPAFTAQQLISVAAARDPEIKELVADFRRLFADREVKETNVKDLGKEGVDWFAPGDTEPYDPERDDPRDDPNYGYDRKPTKPQPTIAPGAKKTQEANAGKFGQQDNEIEDPEQIVPGKESMQDEKLDEAKLDKSSPIYKDYEALKKKSIADLRNIIGRNHRVVDLKGYDKAGAIRQVLDDRYGERKVDAFFGEEPKLDERSLTKGEEKKREKYVKGMKKSKADFKKRYGKRGEEVMYATATKMAKEGEGETTGGSNMFGKGIYESLTELENDLDLELGHGITATSQLDRPENPVGMLEPTDVPVGIPSDMDVEIVSAEPKEKNLGDKIADKGAELSAQIDAALADIKRLAGMGN